MEGFAFEELLPFPGLNPAPPYLIVISHIDKTPPHIGFIFNGYYFSLTVKGPEIQIAALIKMRMLKSKKIPTILISLKKPIFHPGLDFLSKTLREGRPLHSGGSCLHPLQIIIEKFWRVNIHKPLIFGLLETIRDHGLIEKSYILKNDPTDLQENHFIIKHYTEIEVRKHINQISILTN